MNLRLQIVDMRDGPEVLELLRLPTDQLIPDEAAADVVILGPTGTSKRRVADRLALTKLLSETPLVYAEFEFRKFMRIIAPGTRALAARARLQLAPTSALWPDLTNRLAKPEDEAARATHRALELSLRWNEILAYPTVLEWQIELDQSRVERISEELAEGVAAALSFPGLTGAVRTYGDLTDDSVHNESILDRLAPWPRAYPLLATHFEDLYPILAGPLQICNAIQQEIGCSLYQISSTSPVPLGLLLIPLERIREARAWPTAARYLIARDESLRPRPADPQRGEYRIANRLYYTRRRQIELLTNGVIEAPPPGFEYAPVVEEKYGDILRIPADEMLVQLCQSGVLERFRREVDSILAEGGSSDTRTRVWQAHFQAFKKWFRDTAVLEHLKVSHGG